MGTMKHSRNRWLQASGEVSFSLPRRLKLKLRRSKSGGFNGGGLRGFARLKLN
jgi:hypothetical protein